MKRGLRRIRCGIMSLERPPPPLESHATGLVTDCLAVTANPWRAATHLQTL